MNINTFAYICSVDLTTGGVNEIHDSNLYRKITGDKYYYRYYYTIISNSLNQLVKEGKLQARYESEKVEPFYEEYSYSKPYRKRNNVGSKTISIYKLKKM